MVRVKRGKIHARKRKKIKKQVKGFSHSRRASLKRAKEALLKAYSQAYRGRKQKKRSFRRLWQIKINAALRARGLKYSQFISKLKKANIVLDRKILADLAENHPQVFEAIIKETK
jgi:large subunit ribosomal protein L20